MTGSGLSSAPRKRDTAVLRAIIFIVVSGGIVSLSWSSLRSPLSHGLFRFFAFESILALILLNVDLWLKDPAFLSSILVLISSGALIAAAKVEESENVRKFGHDYAAYMERTKMFIPFLL